MLSKTRAERLARQAARRRGDGSPGVLACQMLLRLTRAGSLLAIWLAWRAPGRLSSPVRSLLMGGYLLACVARGGGAGA
jgi:hypothetical protein